MPQQLLAALQPVQGHPKKRKTAVDLGQSDLHWVDVVKVVVLEQTKVALRDHPAGHLFPKIGCLDQRKDEMDLNSTIRPILRVLGNDHGTVLKMFAYQRNWMHWQNQFWQILLRWVVVIAATRIRRDLETYPCCCYTSQSARARTTGRIRVTVVPVRTIRPIFAAPPPDTSGLVRPI